MLLMYLKYIISKFLIKTRCNSLSPEKHVFGKYRIMNINKNTKYAFMKHNSKIVI